MISQTNQLYPGGAAFIGDQILLIYSVGQALVVPNWFVGPSYGVAMVFLLVFRVRPEERMMLEEFGSEYGAYMATSKRLIPGVW